MRQLSVFLLLFATCYNGWIPSEAIKPIPGPQLLLIASGAACTEFMATVYINSSDDEAGSTAGTAKATQMPYAPPRLTTTAKPSPGRFQFPASKPLARKSAHSASRSVSVSSSSSRPTPAPENPSSARSTPGVLQAPGSTLNSRDNTAEPTVPMSNGSGKLGSDKISRPSLALERQVNKLTGALEDFRSANDESLKEVQSTLTAIRATIERLEANASSAQANTGTAVDFGAPLSLPPSGSNVNSIPIDHKPIMSNPPASTEIIALITKVVGEARSRVGKKKGSPDENSYKDHARKAFYRMLNIPSAAAVRPFFEDAHGEPDTLPAQFIDPDTLFCQPYPHWTKPLTRQVQWVPTYVERFKAMIPSNQSPLSNSLRSLSDEYIIILLHDGPFKTASAAWKNTKKTEEELKLMRSDSRRYQRGERKVSVRSRHIQAIPALQPSEYAFLSHAGYMSVDESDDEGNLVTKIPSTRSKWVTNLFRAMNVAEYVQSKGRFVPPSDSQIVDAPVPHLERGTGSAKVIVRIAECAISKSWRASHPDDYARFAHLVSASESIKPNILDFLERYPLSLLNRNEDELLVKEEGGSKICTREAALVEWVPTASMDYDGDEESGMILEVLELDRPEVANPEVGSTMQNIPIDPNLQPAHYNGSLITPPSHYESSPPPVENILDQMFAPSTSESDMPLPPPALGMLPPPVLEMPPPALEILPPPALEMLPPPPVFGMPPPPPLPSLTIADPDQAMSTQETPAGASQVKKRRGRPPGSKNKKQKVTA